MIDWTVAGIEILHMALQTRSRLGELLAACIPSYSALVSTTTAVIVDEAVTPDIPQASKKSAILSIKKVCVGDLPWLPKLIATLVNMMIDIIGEMHLLMQNPMTNLCARCPSGGSIVTEMTNQTDGS